MLTPNKTDYDVIIIGAGISGLVCGCYLAKAGLRTLIVEKNSKPGGYCTSFIRGEHTFDACAHSLGGLQKKGAISNILQDLKISINLKRCDPLDIIISPQSRISINTNLIKTIKEFSKVFPNEAENINKFFYFLDKYTPVSLYSLRSNTFKNVLDKFFTNPALKTLLSYPLMGNSGLPPSRLSAITAVTIYKDFILGGGYYIEGGIQKFPAALIGKLKTLGGKILLSSLVSRIIIKNSQIQGIKLENGCILTSKYIVSNIDAKHTFFNLIGKKHISKQFISKLRSLKPTLSTFTLYLGVDKQLKIPFPPCTNIWYFSSYDIEKTYIIRKNGEIEQNCCFLMFISPNKSNITLQAGISYKHRCYWKKNIELLCKFFMIKLDQIIPGISKHSIIKTVATPQDLQRITLNYKGASFGWESTPSQFATKGLSQITPINNLFLTGHWTTLYQGVSGVAYSGKNTARLILLKTNFIKK